VFVVVRSKRQKMELKKQIEKKDDDEKLRKKMNFLDLFEG